MKGLRGTGASSQNQNQCVVKKSRWRLCLVNKFCLLPLVPRSPPYLESVFRLFFTVGWMLPSLMIAAAAPPPGRSSPSSVGISQSPVRRTCISMYKIRPSSDDWNMEPIQIDANCATRPIRARRRQELVSYLSNTFSSYHQVRGSSRRPGTGTRRIRRLKSSTAILHPIGSEPETVERLDSLERAAQRVVVRVPAGAAGIRASFRQDQRWRARLRGPPAPGPGRTSTSRALASRTGSIRCNARSARAVAVQGRGGTDMTVLFFPGLLKDLFFLLGLAGHGRSANFFLHSSSLISRTHARAYTTCAAARQRGTRCA
jgi:hypothetical protein